ncbi:VWA domain-containing protein [Brachybacterium sp. ACRRE]|uniref:vWA domain-containing protein n=1 Tax=Brachybacterium sp. ACRRE TaxID=2918184 RepID=UPI001EF2E497|nr:VWA domain-containing protein [Brachybacterium sp. ACRRE]MCG7307937.1 VWA domain-containing protein [Brachybacterium sp. ACRRE]
MHLEHLIPLWATILVFVPLLALAVVMMVRRPRQRWAWLRRALMVALLAVVALRPATYTEAEQTQRMNANVFFVVDRTGSMNAEDYAEGQPRLDGVKHDMEQIMSETQGSRYSIISFDSTAASQLPLTTDAGAAKAWINTLATESTAQSKGSNVDRPLATLTKALSDAQTDDPDSYSLVYFLSDGENTDDRDAEPFDQLKPMIDGGAVLGYGTSEGGPMKASGAGTHGEYITDSSGAKGISRIDEDQLKTIAQQMGVPYLHRTDPEAPIEGTMEGITLKPIPIESRRDVASFRDWYWVAAIPLAALFIWELGEMTYRLPRRRDHSELLAATGAGSAGPGDPPGEGGRS